MFELGIGKNQSDLRSGTLKIFGPRQNSRTLLGGVVLAGLFLTMLLIGGSASAATITVDTQADEWNTGAGCSLREAIGAANTDTAFGGCTAGSGDDVILVPAGTYLLSLTGAGEDTNALGDLDLASNIDVIGAGAGLTVVDGGGADRVFHILAGTTVGVHNLTVQKGTVVGDGGGIRVEGSTILSGVVIERCEASGNGGGVMTIAPLTLDRCVLQSNEALNTGGGGLYSLNTVVLIEQSTLADNRTAGSGGGLLVLSSTAAVAATILNSTISSNRADWHGGGINVITGGISISHSTIVFNEGNLGNNGALGGGIRISGGSATVKNSVLASNLLSGGAADAHDCTADSLTSGGFNLVLAPGNCVSGLGSDDLVGLEPRLAPLANYGGETLSHLPLPGSPLRNAGICTDNAAADVLVDQRGAPRPNEGACDIGAVEWYPLSLILSTPEPVGANCLYGGSRLDLGEDTDFDGALNAGELASTAYLCNPEPPTDGSTSLIRVVAVGVGDATCAEGGQLLLSGLDNGDGNGVADNGVLHDDEVDGIPTWVCNGLTGIAGSTSLIRVESVPVGDASCPGGGQEIFVGLDNGDGGSIANDGVLQNGEVDQTPALLCHGLDGAQGPPGTDGANGIVLLEALIVGDATCPDGGHLLYFGLDNGDGSGTAANGVLEADEQDAPPVWVCHGSDGVSTLVVVEAVPAGDATCPEGGQRILVGLDNGDGSGVAIDGVLHPDEVDGLPHYACNGDSGVIAHLLRVDALPVGDTSCPEGGQIVQGGLDNGDGGGIEGDGILQDGEIDSLGAVLCNGESGPGGTEGGQALVETTALPTGDATCPTGGERVDVGVDDDRDGQLDPQEVDTSFWVCNGDSGGTGTNSLIEVTELAPGDEICEFGGRRLDTGLDLDGDGMLAASEIADSATVCNGGNVPVSVEGGAGCSSGRSHNGAGVVLALFGLLCWIRRR
jgi:CSLREA domain-containing protein